MQSWWPSRRRDCAARKASDAPKSVSASRIIRITPSVRWRGRSGLSLRECRGGGRTIRYADGGRRKDRKSVGSGKSVSVRVGLGGRRYIKTTKTKEII